MGPFLGPAVQASVNPMQPPAWHSLPAPTSEAEAAASAAYARGIAVGVAFARGCTCKQ